MKLSLKIDQALDIVLLTTKQLPVVLTDATIPPINITQFPAIKISGVVHFFTNLLAIILTVPSGGV